MRLLVGLVVAFFASHAFGEEISHARGHVLYSSQCSSNYVFGYFDGKRSRHLCIANQAPVNVRSFLDESTTSDCDGEVVVVRASIKNNTLFAQEIDAAWGCGNVG